LNEDFDIAKSGLIQEEVGRIHMSKMCANAKINAIPPTKSILGYLNESEYHIDNSPEREVGLKPKFPRDLILDEILDESKSGFQQYKMSKLYKNKFYYFPSIKSIEKKPTPPESLPIKDQAKLLKEKIEWHFGEQDGLIGSGFDQHTANMQLNDKDRASNGKERFEKNQKAFRKLKETMEFKE